METPKANEEIPQYDGKRLRSGLLELEWLLEQQAIDRFRQQFPNGFPFNEVLKDCKGQVVGKAIITSTVDLNSSDSFKKMWEDSEHKDTLHRVFVPAYYQNKKDKKDGEI